MIKYGLAFGALLLMGACATDVQSAETTGKRLTASEKIGTTVEVNEAGEEIICRREKQTGSRLKYNEVCGTQAEWDRADQENREKMRDLRGRRAASNSS